jgi:shikimate kinase
VITFVLGAAGSGKSTAAQPLASALPAHLVLDWDAFMVPAGALAGREITQHPDTWPAYQQLVGTVLDAAAQAMFRLWQYSHCGAHHERDPRLSFGRWPSAVI